MFFLLPLAVPEVGMQWRQQIVGAEHEIGKATRPSRHAEGEAGPHEVGHGEAIIPGFGAAARGAGGLLEMGGGTASCRDCCWTCCLICRPLSLQLLRRRRRNRSPHRFVKDTREAIPGFPHRAYVRHGKVRRDRHVWREFGFGTPSRRGHRRPPFRHPVGKSVHGIHRLVYAVRDSVCGGGNEWGNGRG